MELCFFKDGCLNVFGILRVYYMFSACETAKLTSPDPALHRLELCSTYLFMSKWTKSVEKLVLLVQFGRSNIWIWVLRSEVIYSPN